MDKHIRTTVIIVVIIWTVIVGFNILRLSNGLMPIITIPCGTADDGGSGIYVGLGYMFEIDVHIHPDHPSPIVDSFNVYIVGFPIYIGIQK